MKTIGQLARSTGCHIETIRFYEKRGLLAKPLRSAGGHRLYSPTHEQRLAFIRHARELGFGLDAISELIALAEGGQHSCQEALAVAERHLGVVSAKLVQLQRIQDALTHMTCACRGSCGRTQAPRCNILESLAAS